MDRVARRPVLIAMKGGPGSGKSTLAGDLSRHLRCPLVDKDDIRQFLDGEDAGAVAYECMLAVAGRQLTQGLDVVCDSPLLQETYRRAAEISEQAQAALVVVEAWCSDEAEWVRRVEGRKQDDLPEHRTTDFEEARRFYDDRSKAAYPVQAPHLRVDTAADRQDSLAVALRWLGEHGIPVE